VEDQQPAAPQPDPIAPTATDPQQQQPAPPAIADDSREGEPYISGPAAALSGMPDPAAATPAPGGDAAPAPNPTMLSPVLPPADTDAGLLDVHGGDAAGPADTSGMPSADPAPGTVYGQPTVPPAADAPDDGQQPEQHQ
jgi:hypothetical protein